MDLGNKPKPSNQYLKYSNLALQLFLGMGLCGWLGYKLDFYLQIKIPVFMILFGLSFFGGMMYQVYKQISK
jgi:hypothetical protein